MILRCKFYSIASVRTLTWEGTEFCNFILIAAIENFTIRVDDTHIVPEHKVTLLRVTLDSRLNVNTRINNILKEVSKNVNALVRIAKYLNKSRKTLLSSIFIYSQFNYCPLVWMFSSKDRSKKIDGLHKRVLRLLHDDYASNYEELLLKDDFVCAHVRNLQFFITEIFKTIHDENPHFMRDVFVREDTRYDVKIKFRLKVPRVNSSTYGLHSVCFRGSELWNMLPNHFKNLPSVSTFKNKIRDWDGSGCHCNICN